MEERVEVEQGRYRNVKDQGMADALPGRVKTLIDLRLASGDAHLDSNQLAKAMQNYQELLKIGELTEVQRADVNLKITNALYVYSERMLHNENWDEARQALEQLKRLNLPPR